MARKSVDLSDWRIQQEQDVLSRRKHFEVPKKPLTSRHLDYIETIKRCDVTLVTGPAGSCKTALACQVAAEMVKAGRIQKIVLSRPQVECDEETGFLPGDINEKLGPFVAPLVESLKDQLGVDVYRKMFVDGLIQIVPLGFMRGLNFHHSFVIIDEAQSATFNQLTMAITRIGYQSKMVIDGDIAQSDIDGPSPLLKAIKLLMAAPRHPSFGLSILTSEDVLRSEVAKFAASRLAKVPR